MAKPAVQIVMTVLTIELVGFARDQRLQSYDPRSRSPLGGASHGPCPLKRPASLPILLGRIENGADAEQSTAASGSSTRKAEPSGPFAKAAIQEGLVIGEEISSGRGHPCCVNIVNEFQSVCCQTAYAPIDRHERASQLRTLIWPARLCAELIKTVATRVPKHCRGARTLYAPASVSPGPLQRTPQGPPRCQSRQVARKQSKSADGALSLAYQQIVVLVKRRKCYFASPCE